VSEQEIAPVVEGPAGPPARPASPWRRRGVVVVLASLLIGAVAGGVWRLLVQPPYYTVGLGGAAQITERGLARVFGVDAWFMAVGLVAGLGIGVLVWRLFGGLGWPSAIIALVAGVVGGVICWQVGQAFGPRDFADRLAVVEPGGRVQMDFLLRSKSALAMWPIGALLPTFLYAAAMSMSPRAFHRAAAPEVTE